MVRLIDDYVPEPDAPDVLERLFQRLLAEDVANALFCYHLLASAQVGDIPSHRQLAAYYGISNMTVGRWWKRLRQHAWTVLTDDERLDVERNRYATQEERRSRGGRRRRSRSSHA